MVKHVNADLIILSPMLNILAGTLQVLNKYSMTKKGTFDDGANHVLSSLGKGKEIWLNM